jgi:copper chaperone CopZ
MKLDGEICANCAGKIQARIEQIPGVRSASVNAMTMKFTLDADDAAFDDALSQSIEIFSDIEPDCDVLR